MEKKLRSKEFLNEKSINISLKAPTNNNKVELSCESMEINSWNNSKKLINSEELGYWRKWRRLQDIFDFSECLNKIEEIIPAKGEFSWKGSENPWQSKCRKRCNREFSLQRLQRNQKRIFFFYIRGNEIFLIKTCIVRVLCERQAKKGRWNGNYTCSHKVPSITTLKGSIYYLLHPFTYCVKC